MSSSEIPRKRPRVESPPPTENTTSETGHDRDTEFWFEDGTIILIAGNFEFRVYKGILASCSTVFRNMFTFPQPESSSTSATSSSSSTSDCPFVHVADSPEDIREILRCLMPGKGSSTPFSPDARPTFQAVSACVRLGHKYELDHLLDSALGYLRRYYPTDFNTYASHPAPPPSFRPVHSIGVVNLARLIGAHDLLPIALYECCALQATELLEGFHRDDGTHESLSRADLALCIKAQAALVKAHVQRAVSITTGAQYVPSMHVYMTCKFAVDNVAHTNLTHIGTMTNTRALAMRPLWIIEGPPGTALPCTNCMAFLENQDLAQRRWVWNCLPNLIGVAVVDWKQA
ncbi:hypothetical protein GSI_12072 [Ganoderma sinense ZZ0214-1]|uniref:BTB domain-containing protein n=1 Tax=Ganoderma sinense ZZ0214-1 TaxID=1077348 RepID=A0A2G8RXS2_9APHY|nr:hypothetical protein GSI_12072 [Ganoderma sinense ZZ0214-1]